MVSSFDIDAPTDENFYSSLFHETFNLFYESCEVEERELLQGCDMVIDDLWGILAALESSSDEDEELSQEFFDLFTELTTGFQLNDWQAEERSGAIAELVKVMLKDNAKMARLVSWLEHLDDANQAATGYWLIEVFHTVRIVL